MAETLLFRGGNTADVNNAATTVNDREIVIDTQTNQVVLGSAKKRSLMMDNADDVVIDSSGNVGIGTSDPGSYLAGSNQLVVGSESTGAGITIFTPDASAGSLTFAEGTGAADNARGSIKYFHNTTGANGYMQFAVNTAPQMTIKTTGVGIGTTSPDTALHVVGAATSTQLLLTDATNATIRMGTPAAGIGILSVNTGQNLVFGHQSAAGSTYTERMRIDSSGRLLVGTSSSSTGDTLVLQANSGSSVGNATLRLRRGATPGAADQIVGFIGFEDSNGNSGASILAASDGGGWASGSNHRSRLVFSTTASGSSTPTSRMTIDSSGNVGVGTSSPGVKLTISDTGTTPGLSTFNGGNSADITSFAARAGLELIGYQSDSGSPYTKTSALIANSDGTVPSEMQFWTKTSGQSSPAERMRIDSSGNVGVGTTSPGSKLTIQRELSQSPSQGGITFKDESGNTLSAIGIDGNSSNELRIMAGSGDVIAFHTNSDLATTNEAARIDASGRLLVGTTSSLESSSLLQVYKSSGTNQALLKSGTLSDGQFIGFRAEGPSDRTGIVGSYKHSGIINPCAFLRLSSQSGSHPYYWTDDSGNFRISTTFDHIGTANGTVVGTQTSDERLKNVGADFSYGLTEVLQLQPKQYALKTEPDTNKLGFIAQEVESIIPEAVFDTGEKLEGHQEGDRTKLGMEYVQLIPVLVNAIKEQQVTINDLQTRLAALEAN